MSDQILQFVLSESIIIAFVIGIVRLRIMDPAYYPFVLFTGAALLMELLAGLLPSSTLQYWHLPALHVYSYVEFALFTWLFHNWGLFNRNRVVFGGILIVSLVFWFIASFFIHGFKIYNSYFLVLSSFALIFFSVSTFNKLVIQERKSILKNASFLICIGIIIFYTIFVIFSVTVLSVYRQNVSGLFRQNMQKIMVITNLLVNLLYAVAMLWVPRKKHFMTPF